VTDSCESGKEGKDNLPEPGKPIWKKGQVEHESTSQKGGEPMVEGEVEMRHWGEKRT